MADRTLKYQRQTPREIIGRSLNRLKVGDTVTICGFDCRADLYDFASRMLDVQSFHNCVTDKDHEHKINDADRTYSVKRLR